MIFSSKHDLFRLLAAAAFVCAPPAHAESNATCKPAGTRSSEIAVHSDVQLAGAKIVVRYPKPLSIPGVRDDASVGKRLTRVPPGFTTLVNDGDGVLVVTLASGSATLPSGVSFAVEFDRCEGGDAGVRDLQCAVEQAADATGQLVEGATCTAQLS